jgi:hypothetical protein
MSGWSPMLARLVTACLVAQTLLAAYFVGIETKKPPMIVVRRTDSPSPKLEEGFTETLHEIVLTTTLTRSVYKSTPQNRVEKPRGVAVEGGVDVITQLSPPCNRLLSSNFLSRCVCPRRGGC